MPSKTKKYSLSFLYFLIFFLIITTNFVLIVFDNIILSIFGSLFLMLLLLFFLRTVIKPLNQLTDACEQIRKGNLEIKIKNHYRTEIGELIDTFNKMVSELNKSKLTMEEAKDVLEIRVRARTRQLRELLENQEETIKARTKELEERVKELERFRRLTVGRELKMMELKKELKNAPKGEVGKHE
jgi:methyl-accepting chemotaxis protein